MSNDLSAIEQRWILAVQNAGFGVWDLDISGQRVHYPPQWKALLGYGDGEEADSTATWRDRVHADDLGPMLAALTSHLSGGTPAYEAEFRIRTADGHYRWVLSRGRVVERDAQGVALRAVGTLTDLTDRKEAERLRRERDIADAADRAKTAILSRMSHELRTPLNAVLGFAQLLKQRLGSASAEEQGRQLAHVERAGWQLLRLIDELLELARAESQRLSSDARPVLLAPLVLEVLQSQAASAQVRGVELVGPTAPEPATVHADAEQTRQLIGHIVDNAIRYNRPGGRVVVTLLPGSDDRSWTLQVSDTGPGIPADLQANLFEPFNRTGRDAAGTPGVGIGLLLARTLAQAVGGGVALVATGDDGTTFAVTLPSVGGPSVGG